MFVHRSRSRSRRGGFLDDAEADWTPEPDQDQGKAWEGTPLFLSEQDPEIARQAPGAPMQQGGQGQGGPSAKPVKDVSQVADRITSISMDVAQTPNVKMFPHGPQGAATHVQIRPDRPMAFDGKVSFKPGPSLGSMKFGFFQIGRPYEAYHGVYTRAGSHSAPDIEVYDTMEMRKDLPAQDHHTQMWEDANDGPVTETIGSGAQRVQAGMDDTPSTPFQIERPYNGDTYRLSGVSVASFFFTGFGVIWNGQPLVLATRYWTARYCETLPLSADLNQPRQKQVPIDLSQTRDCRSHGGDLGEAGAGSASGNAPGWGNATQPSKTYAYLMNSVRNNASTTNGPGNFDVGCG